MQESAYGLNLARNIYLVVSRATEVSSRELFFRKDRPIANTLIVCHAIDHKSISRQHLIIDVARVQPGDGVSASVRSQSAAWS